MRIPTPYILRLTTLALFPKRFRDGPVDSSFFFLATARQCIAKQSVSFGVFGLKGYGFVEIGDSLFCTSAKQVVLPPVVVYFEIGCAEFGGAVEALECIFVLPVVLQRGAIAYP